MYRNLIGLFFLLLLPSVVFADPCTISSQTGDVCEVQIANLFPTQFNVGLREVNERAQKFQAMSAQKLQAYIAANPALVVIGPGGRVYCTDKQHLAHALQDIGVTSMLGSVQGNLANLSELDFLQGMKSNAWVYLYNLGKGPLDFAQLPKSIAAMGDDPFRSLAWYVRGQGGYTKSTAVAYADFQWADFFRTRIALGSTDAEFNKAVDLAVVLAHSKSAQDLPGWSP